MTTRQLPGRTGVLDAAADLFLGHGYAGTTVRDIAEAAGMKAGSIYYHFDSKDEILTAILDVGMSIIDDALTEAMTLLDDEAPATVRLHAAVTAHLEALFEHGPYTAAHVRLYHDSPPDVRAAGRPARDAYERRWAGLLEAAQRAGHVAADVDLTILRLSLFGAMNGALAWYRPDGERSLDEVAITITHMCTGGAA